MEDGQIDIHRKSCYVCAVCVGKRHNILNAGAGAEQSGQPNGTFEIYEGEQQEKKKYIHLVMYFFFLPTQKQNFQNENLHKILSTVGRGSRLNLVLRRKKKRVSGAHALRERSQTGVYGTIKTPCNTHEADKFRVCVSLRSQIISRGSKPNDYVTLY